MINFYLAHKPLFALLFFVVIFTILLYFVYIRKVPIAKKALYYYVCEAEKYFGSGTGKIKLAMVVTKFYSYIPFYVKFFFPQERVLKWAEQAVVLLKEQLSEGMNLKGLDE